MNRCTACMEGQGEACTCRQPDVESADVIVGLLYGGVFVVCVVVVALWWGLT